MGDFISDEEEEAYYRSIARRMKVRPNRVAKALASEGFELTYASRDPMENKLAFGRLTPGLAGLFDIIEIQGTIDGERVSTDLYVSILPTGYRCPVVKAARLYVSPRELGYDRDDVRVKNPADAVDYEQRLVAHVPRLFNTLHKSEGRQLAEESRCAREAAIRYLQWIKPEADLHPTLARLRAQATPQQLRDSERYLKSELLNYFGLDDFRVVLELGGLAQVCCWEFPAQPFRGLSEVSYKQAGPFDIEAHRRFYLVCSRLAREPGWPEDDPFLPPLPAARPSDDIEPVTAAPQGIAEVVADFLASRGKRCKCGSPFKYLAHEIDTDEDPPLATIKVICENGHLDLLELDWDALRPHAG